MYLSLPLVASALSNDHRKCRHGRRLTEASNPGDIVLGKQLTHWEKIRGKIWGDFTF